MLLLFPTTGVKVDVLLLVEHLAWVMRLQRMVLSPFVQFSALSLGQGKLNLIAKEPCRKADWRLLWKAKKDTPVFKHHRAMGGFMCKFLLSTPSDVQNFSCSPPFFSSPFNSLVFYQASLVWLLCGAADGRSASINRSKSVIKGSTLPNLPTQRLCEEKKLFELVLKTENKVLSISLMKNDGGWAWLLL